MNDRLQKLHTIHLVRYLLIAVGIILFMVFSVQAFAQASSWEAVAGRQQAPHISSLQ